MNPESTTERLVIENDARQHVVREHLARYEFAAPLVRGRSVLDAACGSGYGSALLRHAGATRVAGIDISADAIAHAKAHYAVDGVQFHAGSVERIEVPGPFGAIVSFETVEHVAAPEAFLAETVRLLDRDGVFIVSTPVRRSGTIDTPPANPHHVREWSAPEFEALLRSYYADVSLFAQHTFAKNPLPYSRTIKRWLFARRYPEALADLDRLPVRAEPPAFPGFSFERAYLVAVCRQP